MSKRYKSGNLDAAIRHFIITPDDNNDLPDDMQCIYILADGDLAVRDIDGVDITYPVTAGPFIFRPTRILTGTSAVVVGWS